MKKAHNMVEISLLICFVLAVAIASWNVYNNQKMKLADLSKPALRVQAVNLKTMDESKAEEKIPYTSVETAGTNALTVLGMSSEEFTTKVSDISYETLKESSQNQETDIFNLANSLITMLKLNYNQVSAENITPETLATFVGVLNAAVDVTSGDAKPTADTFVTQFKSLLD